MQKNILTFSNGLNTKLQPHLLDKNTATNCIDVDLTKGSLYPFNSWVDVTADYIAPTGIYATVYKGDLVTNSDTTEKRSYALFGSRLYYTDGGYSAQGLYRYDTVARAGVNAVAPTVTTYGTIGLVSGSGSALNETYSYVYTVVDTDGIESTPSPAYVHTVANADIDITLTVTGEVVTETVSKRRIYRTGGANPTYNLIAELDVATLAYTDSTRDLNVSRVELTTWDNYGPIAGLTHLVENNGTMWASYGERIYFSENGQPEFWNPLDFLALIDDCTGIGVLQDVVVAFTISDVYVIRGYNRDNVSIEKLPYTEGAVGHWTIANVDRYLMWTSRSGICRFDGNSIDVVTRNLIAWGQDDTVGDDTFGDYEVSPMDVLTFNSTATNDVKYALGFDGKYYAVFKNIIGVMDMNFNITSTLSLTNSASLVYDYEQNTLNSITDDSVSGYDMYAFNMGDSLMTALWKTGQIQDEGYDIKKQYRRVELDAVPVSVEVFVNDESVIKVYGKRQFYLPSGSIGNTIQFEIISSNEIRSLQYEYGRLS